jgi:hypothetical protein
MPNSLVSAAGGALPAEAKSRRSALALLGGAVALAVALPVKSCEPPEPIFAAIALHREAARAFDAVIGLSDEVAAQNQGREVTEADEAAYVAAHEAEAEARAALVSTAPQTLAGMRAAIEYLAHVERGCVPESSGAFLTTLLKSPLLAA